jgi:hypothetical protein
MERDSSIKSREQAREAFKTTHLSWKAPRYEFFIFATQDSIDSVLQYPPDDEKAIAAPGTYYFTVVATGLENPREYTELFDDDNDEDWDGEGIIWKDREDIIETRRALYQKFKANEFVGLYAACDVDSLGWPDVFRDDDGGVSKCF